MAMAYDEEEEARLDAQLLSEESEMDAVLTALDDEYFDDDVLLQKHDELVDVSPSRFTEFAIKIPVAGAIDNFNFQDRPYLRRIYDTGHRRILLLCGRQTEKSTSLGNISLAWTSLNVAFKVLYVSATAQQASVFSADRLKSVVDMSPVVRSLTTTRLSQSVWHKQFLNHSQIRVRYAFLNADRTRGIPADMILIDEIQDIFSKNLPVIEQCASHSLFKILRYSGTPKSMDNTIQIYWDQFSTQNEWAVPCYAHAPRHWNILGENNIGKLGPVCAKCGAAINPLSPDCKWVSKQPRNVNNANRVSFDGYRITQLMVPWIVKNPDAWHEHILIPYSTYDKAQFLNEVIGISYDSGMRPLTKYQIQRACRDDIDMNDVEGNMARCEDGVYVGIDHGTDEATSRSVVSLAGYIDGKFTIFYVHVFEGAEADPTTCMEMTAALMTAANFVVAGVDYGGGFDRNDFLARAFGAHKIKKFQYVGRLKQKVRWEPKLKRFVMHRTEVMSDVFNAIRRCAIALPRWEQFEPFAADILNIFSEYSNTLRMIQYKISPGKPDDVFHSILYCLFGSMVAHPRTDIIIPIKDT